MPRLSLDERRAKYREWVTGRLAASAAATPTSSESTSGVPTTPVVPTPAVRQDAGSAPTTPMPGRIVSGSASIAELRSLALELPNPSGPVAAFVMAAFAEPHPPRKQRLRDYREAGLLDGRLEFWPILARAKEWDELGESTALEFVDALACDVVGHPKGDAVTFILRDLSTSASDPSTDQYQPDDYDRWRYG